MDAALLPPCEQQAAALAHQLERQMQALLAASTAQLGSGLLLTVNAHLTYPLPAALPEGAVLQLQRIWTSDAARYPIAGGKAKPLTPWTRQLLVEGTVFVGEGDAAIATHFNDHATIAGMGLHSVINTPLCDAQGRCFATVNVLSPHTQWPAGAVSAISAAAQHTAPAVQAYCSALRAVLRPPAGA